MAERYVSALTGPEMDAALLDMAQHNSEAWAVGTRNGAAVSSSDETYDNNSKYYATEAEAAAARAEAAVPAGTEGAVLFSQAQSLTDAQKAQAYNNMMPGQLSAQGIKLPGWAVAGGTTTKRGLTEGWYRLATISSVAAKLVRVMYTADYSTAIPATFDLSLFANYNYSGNFRPEWISHFVRGAGRSISKIRIGADGNSLATVPQYLDVYVNRQLNTLRYYAAVMVLGSDDVVMSDLTPVSTPPAIVNEYTLADTGA